MTLSMWLGLVAICMMGAMSPGPSLAVVLKHSLNGSMKNGMLAALTPYNLSWPQRTNLFRPS